VKLSLLSSTSGPQNPLGVEVLEEPPREDPIKKSHTSFAYKGHLPPSLQWEPLLDHYPSIGLPEVYGGPTFVFIFIEVFRFVQSIVAPLCLGVWWTLLVMVYLDQ
jgi:hypothetical protein